MLLSARILDNVGGVNSFRYVNDLQFTEGDGPQVYFQLVDLTAVDGTAPRRYMPAAGATLQVQILNIDDAKKLTRFASQPYATDPSIWLLTLLPTDHVRGTVDLRLTLTEGSKVTSGACRQALSVEPLQTAF